MIKTITIATSTGPKRQWAVVEGALAVHPSTWHSDTYALTHIPSGWAVYHGSLPQLCAIRKDLLASRIDWDFKPGLVPKKTARSIALILRAHDRSWRPEATRR